MVDFALLYSTDFALLYSTSSLMISAFLKLPFLRMLYCMCLCISVGVCGGREWLLISAYYTLGTQSST